MSDAPFRKGAATSAREASIGNDEIMLLERWKSDSYRLSITTYPERILLASRQYQHLPSYLEYCLVSVCMPP